MKQGALLAKFSLFPNDTHEEKYLKMKDAFGLLLNRTIERCSKYCDYRESQERYAGACSEAIHGLIERRVMIDSSAHRVLLELERIDGLQSVDLKITSLKAYAKGLAERQFSALFMVILSGELNKRWLHLAEELIPASEFYTLK